MTTYDVRSKAIREWIDGGRKNPALAFSSGPERDLADRINVVAGDSAIRECIQGAKELGESLADAVKLASWYALLARAANCGIEWGERRSGDHVLGCYVTVPRFLSDQHLYGDFDDNRLPLETPELRAALTSALGEK